MTKTLFVSVFLASCLPAQDGTGPFPAGMEQDPGLPAYTVYRPKEMAALQGKKLPIVAWGNGPCVNNGASYKNFLTEIASRGFLAIAENGRTASQYYNRIDTAKIAVMGHSCGGIQALAVAADPRIKLVGNWSGGLFVTPPKGAAGMVENVPKEQLQKLHSPVFYISGDSTDIAYENVSDDFRRIAKVPAFRAWKEGIGHGGTYNQPNGGECARVAVALLEWQFNGDQEAGKMFLGAECGLCKDAKWHVEKKGIN